MKTLSQKGYARVPKEVKLDLRWWINFMERFDGRTCIPEVVWSRPDLVFSTDACLRSCGGWSPAATSGRVDNQFFSVFFPAFILGNKDVSINELEAVALLVGIKIWGPACRGKRILVNCDNQATVAIVNTGRAHNVFAQSCMRELHYWAAVHDFQVRAVYLSSSDNRMADITSRMTDNEHYQKDFAVLTKYMKVTEIRVDEKFFCFTDKW